MNKLVIDLEMTHSRRIATDETHSITLREIIEIGAVLLDKDNNVINTFQTYVKPKYTKLDGIIRELTHISDEQLDSADYIEENIHKLEEFVGDCSNTIMYTWSENDSKQLIKELNFKGFNNAKFINMIGHYKDIQIIFQERLRFQNKMNLAKALQLIGIDFKGEEHGALTDALNTAEMLRRLENDDKVKEIIGNINEVFNTDNQFTNTISSMIDFSKFIICEES